jgi:hypothetical protein
MILQCSFTIEIQADRQASLEVSPFLALTDISVGHVKYTNPFRAKLASQKMNSQNQKI